MPTRVGLPLLGGSKLRAHVSSQPGLLGKVVPFRLLLTEELGLVPNTSNDTLKRRPVSKTRKHKKHERKKKMREKIKQIPGQ